MLTAMLPYPVMPPRPIATLPEFWIAVVAFIALIIAAVQAIFFFEQLQFIRQSLDDTKLAADAARRAADHAEASVLLARETAKRQLRAYVMVDAAEPLEEAGIPQWPQAASYRFVIKNLGQTPAAEVMVRVLSTFLPSPPQELPRPDVSPNASSTVIGPGGGVDINTVPRTLGEGQLTAARAGTHSIFLVGLITYKDVFGDSHETRFVYRRGLTHRLLAHAAGNSFD